MIKISRKFKATILNRRKDTISMRKYFKSSKQLILPRSEAFLSWFNYVTYRKKKKKKKKKKKTKKKKKKKKKKKTHKITLY